MLIVYHNSFDIISTFAAAPALGEIFLGAFDDTFVDGSSEDSTFAKVTVRMTA